MENRKSLVILSLSLIPLLLQAEPTQDKTPVLVEESAHTTTKTQEQTPAARLKKRLQAQTSAKEGSIEQTQATEQSAVQTAQVPAPAQEKVLAEQKAAANSSSATSAKTAAPSPAEKKSSDIVIINSPKVEESNKTDKGAAVTLEKKQDAQVVDTKNGEKTTLPKLGEPASSSTKAETKTAQQGTSQQQPAKKTEATPAKTEVKTAQQETTKKQPAKQEGQKNTAQQQTNGSNQSKMNQTSPSMQQQKSVEMQKQENAKMQQARIQKNNERAKADENDPYNMQRCSMTGLHIDAEWLYWKFTEGGTEYAVTNEELSGDLNNARSHSASFGMQSGFRVGAGYHTPQGGWDLYAAYTQISPTANNSVSGNIVPLLYYQRISPATRAASASTNWHIQFKTLDFEFARQYYITKSLMIRPHAGLRGASIKQNALISYTDLSIPGISFEGPLATVNEHTNFAGVGLRLGMGCLWEMGAGFGLFGNLSASLLASRMHTHQVQNQFEFDGTTPVESINLKNTTHPLLPNMQMDLGLQWATCFSDDRFRFAINAAFESQYWWRQNQLEHFTNFGTLGLPPMYVRPTEDLGMYGLTLGARFDF